MSEIWPHDLGGRGNGPSQLMFHTGFRKSYLPKQVEQMWTNSIMIIIPHLIGGRDNFARNGHPTQQNFQRYISILLYLGPQQNDRHFAEDNFECFFLGGNISISNNLPNNGGQFESFIYTGPAHKKLKKVALRYYKKCRTNSSKYMVRHCIAFTRRMCERNRIFFYQRPRLLILINAAYWLLHFC